MLTPMTLLTVHHLYTYSLHAAAVCHVEIREVANDVYKSRMAKCFSTAAQKKVGGQQQPIWQQQPHKHFAMFPSL